MKHCELFGFKISEEECSKTKSDDYSECQDCTGEEKMAIKPEVKEEARCSECGKKATEDKWFRFSRGKCVACISREDRAKKAGKEPVKKENKPRKAEVKGHPHPGPFPEDEGKKIVLDFSGYPELHERLLKVSKGQMRTPDMQVLFWLKSDLIDTADRL